MPLVSTRGSSPITSSRERPATLRSELQNDSPVLDSQALIQERAVNQSFLNNTSINTDAFKNDLSAIAGYPEGRIIQVTYFSQNAPLADVYTHTADMTTQSKDDVHISWTQIRNFELRLPSAIEYSYDESSNISTVSGEALVFAGFVPRISDIFLYELRNSKIGVFRVSNIRRLALGQDTYHQISFTLQEWMTTVMRDRLQRQSTLITYFDKTKFLLGNHAMLTTEGYIAQKELRHIRQEIIQNYMDRFYDPEFSSFMRPDKIYDPYVVEYWNHKVGYEDCYRRPVQLLIAVSNYKKTIWAALTNNPIKNIKNLAHSWNTSTMHATFWCSNITALLEHKFITVGDEAGAVVYPTIGNRGEPQVMDVTVPFYPLIWSEDIKRRADALFHSFAHWWYDGIAPDRRCPPHDHVVEAPNPFDKNECARCEKIAECIHWPHHHRPHPDKHPDKPHRPHLPPMEEAGPPYPILSDQELFTIWQRLHHIPDDVVLTHTDQIRAQGYIVWYRETYEGTLSAVELERQWRKLAGIPTHQALTISEQASLKKYITSYRSKYLPVLTNRELEIIWRKHLNIPYDEVLSEEQLVQLHKFIINYRLQHGKVPSDQVAPESELGTPITADELRDFDDTKFPAPPDPETPEDTPLPEIYHPKPHHHHFCPKMCHYLCNKPPKPPVVSDEDDDNFYALSKDFYYGSMAMDPFEKVLYDLLTCKEVSPTVVLDAVSRYLEWDDDDAFYRHLFALFMIDRALYWLRFHS